MGGGNVTVAAGKTWSGTSIVLSGGTIGGPGDVTVTNALDWRGGTMNGAGKTTVSGALDIDPGSYAFTSLGRVLRTQGTGVWRSGYVGVDDGARWENSGTVEFNGETGSMYRNQSGDNAPRLVNTGTLKKSAGDGTTSVDIPVDQLGGSVVQESGVLRFGGGGTIASTSEGGTYAGGAWALETGADLTGARFAGGTFRLAAGTPVHFADGSITGGEITGDGDLALGGDVTWSGGEIGGAGALEQEASGTLALAGYVTLERDVYAYGTTHVEGASVAQVDASRWHNHGTIELGPQASWSNGYGRSQLLEPRPDRQAAGHADDLAAGDVQ